MTRENKLALVVGFALILFVGILISDHFSTARNQASANLVDHRPVDPLVQLRRETPDLIDGRRIEPASRVSSPAIETPASARPSVTVQEHPAGVSPRPTDARTVEMGGQTFIVVDEPVLTTPPFLIHEVQAGESLTSITRQRYGTESLVKELAKFNDLDDPNMLRANQRLRIPPAEVLIGGQAASTAASVPAPRAPAPPPPKTYTVKAGDTLSEISQRELGTTRRWREILEINRDVIRDPDNVQVGTVLKLPQR